MYSDDPQDTLILRPSVGDKNFAGAGRNTFYKFGEKEAKRSEEAFMLLCFVLLFHGSYGPHVGRR